MPEFKRCSNIPTILFETLRSKRTSIESFYRHYLIAHIAYTTIPNKVIKRLKYRILSIIVKSSLCKDTSTLRFNGRVTNDSTSVLYNYTSRGYLDKRISRVCPRTFVFVPRNCQSDVTANRGRNRSRIDRSSRDDSGTKSRDSSPTARDFSQK